MKSLNKRQKLSLLGLSFLTILIFFIAFFQFKSNIYRPFNSAANDQGEQQKVSELLDLNNIDTDKDGLNDFNELNVYKTSPYLEDTDGDGIFDKEEIEKGTNPSCPEGEICGTVSVESSSQDSSSDETELSAEEIKDFLIKSGMDKETLDKIDDKTLKEVYNETIKETGINPENLSLEKNLNPDVLKNNQALLENLSAQDIRNILMEGGAEKEILDQIDDKTLRTLFLEALNRQNAKPE
ncbi:MAG: calcium-binding protein [Parcubacteria group bacterium Athens1014_10]|nr:MAG: calcium-binding protein [Parcubacteria group bacterium Athens1014_10]TSD05925.1 MAG: calcium-binding protein [Parcubacteria group bacterium Athens0714_12]